MRRCILCGKRSRAQAGLDTGQSRIPRLAHSSGNMERFPTDRRGGLDMAMTGPRRRQPPRPHELPERQRLRRPSRRVNAFGLSSRWCMLYSLPHSWAPNAICLGGKEMRSLRVLSMLTAMAVALSACGQTPGCRALTGAGIGAAGGAVVGALAGAPLTGAALGAAGGAAVGGLTTSNQINGGSAPCH